MFIFLALRLHSKRRHLPVRPVRTWNCSTSCTVSVTVFFFGGAKFRYDTILKAMDENPPKESNLSSAACNVSARATQSTTR